MANPWDNDPIVSPPRGAGVFTLPPSPRQQQQDARQEANDRRAAALEAERIRLSQQNAEFEREKFYRTHNPDGTPKKAQEVAIKPDLGPVRVEAQNKINLLNSLIDRSKNNWFATGAGTNGVNVPLLGIPIIPGRETPGSNAYDQAQDVETVSGAGALAKVMELAATNGGKNPLTPLSNSDVQLLGKSNSNLDIGQSDEQFQRNARTYRDIYRRALRGAGGVDTSSLHPTGGMNALQQGYASLTQQMQGKSPAERRAMLSRFNDDPRIQALKQRAGFRDPGGTRNAPRKSGGAKFLGFE